MDLFVRRVATMIIFIEMVGWAKILEDVVDVRVFVLDGYLCMYILIER